MTRAMRRNRQRKARLLGSLVDVLITACEWLARLRPLTIVKTCLPDKSGTLVQEAIVNISNIHVDCRQSLPLDWWQSCPTLGSRRGPAVNSPNKSRCNWSAYLQQLAWFTVAHLVSFQGSQIIKPSNFEVSEAYAFNYQAYQGR